MKNSQPSSAKFETLSRLLRFKFVPLKVAAVAKAQWETHCSNFLKSSIFETYITTNKKDLGTVIFQGSNQISGFQINSQSPDWCLASQGKFFYTLNHFYSEKSSKRARYVAQIYYVLWTLICCNKNETTPTWFNSKETSFRILL